MNAFQSHYRQHQQQQMHPIRLHINIQHIDKDSFYLRLEYVCVYICYSYIHLRNSLTEFFSFLAINQKKETSLYILAMFRKMDECIYVIDYTMKKCYLYCCLPISCVQASNYLYTQYQLFPHLCSHRIEENGTLVMESYFI